MPTRPLIGGIQITARSGSKTLVSTLGLPIVDNGQLAFVVAGHAVGNEGEAVGQPDLANLVGKVGWNALADGQDIALVYTNPGVQIAAAQVLVGGQAITVAMNRTGRPALGDTIYIEGAASGQVTGRIRFFADITLPDTGEKLFDVGVINLDGNTQPGDSGAPVLSGTIDGAQCWGVYGGKFVSSGETFGWYTPFDNINWGLSLRALPVSERRRAKGKAGQAHGAAKSEAAARFLQGLTPPLARRVRGAKVGEFEHVTDAGSFPWAAIGQILSKFPDGTVLVGTGCIVGGGAVVTAGHQLYQAAHGGMAVTVQFTPGRDGDARPYGSFGANATRLFVLDAYRQNPSNPANDYGMIGFAEDLEMIVGGRIELFAASDEILADVTFSLTGYPISKSGDEMWTSTGTVAALSDNFIFSENVHGEEGESGSPAWWYQASLTAFVSAGVYIGQNSAGMSFRRVTDGLIDQIRAWISSLGTASTAAASPMTLAASLTSQFLASPVTFMRSYAILIPAQVPAKGGTFVFSPQGTSAAVLQVGTTGTVIRGYYVKPVANNNNQYTLPTQMGNAYYMFTDQMNGCQFIAYGPDRQHLTVEHNNFISNPAQYAVRLATIQATNPAYLFHMTSTGVDNIPGSTYNPAHGVNIVGEYSTAGGWRFWVRDRVDLNQGTVYGPF